MARRKEVRLPADWICASPAMSSLSGAELSTEAKLTDHHEFAENRIKRNNGNRVPGNNDFTICLNAGLVLAIGIADHLAKAFKGHIAGFHRHGQRLVFHFLRHWLTIPDAAVSKSNAADISAFV